VKTTVIQSYRTHGVAGWLDRCLQSVRGWAASAGYGYRFFDDEMFERAPAWYREKAKHNVLLVSDLCRLALARELLEQGSERVVWVDADVIVFDPGWRIETEGGYAFSRELWVGYGTDGKLGSIDCVNNAVSVFCRGNSFLDFYIDACQTIVRTREHLRQVDAGTDFLSCLSELIPHPLLDGIVQLSPAVQLELLGRPGPALELFRRAQRGPARAANLCGSMQGKLERGMKLDEAHFERLVEALVATRGAGLAPDSGPLWQQSWSGLKAPSW
jgi:hypothetical protein